MIWFTSHNQVIAPHLTYCSRSHARLALTVGINHTYYPTGSAVSTSNVSHRQSAHPKHCCTLVTVVGMQVRRWVFYGALNF